MATANRHDLASAHTKRISWATENVMLCPRSSTTPKFCGLRGGSVQKRGSRNRPGDGDCCNLTSRLVGGVRDVVAADGLQARMAGLLVRRSSAPSAQGEREIAY